MMTRPIFSQRQILLLLVLIPLGALFWYLTLRDFNQEFDNQEEEVITPRPSVQNDLLHRHKSKNKVILVAVSCGGRYDQALTMLKSAVLFSRGISLHVVVIADAETQPILVKLITQLQAEAREINPFFTFEMKDVSFPSHNEEIWKQLYAPCSAQRIFLPSLLPGVDSVMYMDSDTLFVSSVKNVWKQLSLMDNVQWAGAAYEDEATGDGWYNTKAEIPYFEPRGLNTGVLLLNLTRMRLHQVEEKAENVLRQYGDKLHWGDQDIFNVIFSSNPEFVLRLPCEYNFRESHCLCRYKGNCSCSSAAYNGIKVIHGNLQAFQKKGSFFQSIYNNFQNYSLEKGTLQDISREISKNYNMFVGITGINCVGFGPQFFKQLRT